jgi:hypothetical protein
MALRFHGHTGTSIGSRTRNSKALGSLPQLIGADDDAAAADCKPSYKYYVAYKLIEDSGSGKESGDRHE